MAKGYLVVQVSLASQSLPLAGAEVKIYQKVDGNANLIKTSLTDPEGKTEKLQVDTPELINSETPDNGLPVFSVFDILITAKGFYSVAVKDAQVFPERTSLQYVNMIPLPEGVREGEKIIVVTPQNL